MEILNWLSKWYKGNCDGDWEHGYGISIETLDNPGWAIKIDLQETSLSGTLLETIEIKVSTDDWYTLSSDGKIFTGYGDASKLIFILETFKDFASTN